MDAEQIPWLNINSVKLLASLLQNTQFVLHFVGSKSFLPLQNLFRSLVIVTKQHKPDEGWRENC